MHPRQFWPIFGLLIGVLLIAAIVLLTMNFSGDEDESSQDKAEIHAEAYKIGERMTDSSETPVSEEEKKTVADRLSGQEETNDSGESHYTIGQHYENF